MNRTSLDPAAPAATRAEPGPSGLSRRPYQVKAIDSAWEMRHRNPLIVLPTGCGKTITALSIAADRISAGHRVLWLAHRSELLDQPLATWNACWPGVGAAGVVRAEDRSGVDAQLVIGSVPTLQRLARLDEVLAEGIPDLVVWDEAHHAASPTYRRVRERLDEVGVGWHLGLSATPERADRRGLGSLFTIAYVYLLSNAIADGNLVPFRAEVVRLPDLDLSEVRSGADGDYNESELADALLRAEVVRHTADAILEHASTRRGLVFTVTVEQAEETARALEARGLSAEVVHGAMSADDRRSTLARHRTGEIQWLCNCAVLTEGYDDPGIDAVVIARPTRSRPLYVQQVGRGLRLAPGKADCLILDVSGASDEHDMITAAVLLEDDSAEDRRKGAGAGPTNRSLYATMWGERGRSRYTWLPVPNVDCGAFVVGCGTSGSVAIVATDLGWSVWLLPRDRDAALVPLASAPVGMSIAMALGEDVVRRSSAGRIASSAATWRDEPPTAAQISALQKWRVEQTRMPRSKGGAADLMTQLAASATLRKHRIAGWSSR